MRKFEFQQQTLLDQPREEVFRFFADARNLEAITPPWLRFSILTPDPIVMRRGATIDYRLRVHGIPLRWQTAITQWDPPYGFTDEQYRGPYRLWIHRHRFEDRDGTTRMLDHITYAVPGGWLMDRLFVRRDVQKIFDYRQICIRRHFGNNPNPLG